MAGSCNRLLQSGEIMKRRSPPPLPPGHGSYGPFEIVEAISEEEKAGRLVDPPIELGGTRRPVELDVALSEEERAGRPVAPS